MLDSTTSPHSLCMPFVLAGKSQEAESLSLSLVEHKKPSALLVTLAMLFNSILPCGIKLKQ